MGADSLPVFPGRVPLVAVKIVNGILPMEIFHDPVPGNLGDDTGGGNRGAFRFTFDQGFLGDGQRHLKFAVDKEEIGCRPCDVFNCQPHRQKRCLQDIEPVDLLFGNNADTDEGAYFPESVAEIEPSSVGEDL